MRRRTPVDLVQHLCPRLVDVPFRNLGDDLRGHAQLFHQWRQCPLCGLPIVQSPVQRCGSGLEGLDVGGYAGEIVPEALEIYFDRVKDVVAGDYGPM